MVQVADLGISSMLSVAEGMVPIMTEPGSIPRTSKPVALQRGVIYVLTNRAMPGFVKVGLTTRTSDERARELSRATGVPEAFEVVFDIVVSDVSQVEKLIHERLHEYRTNKQREFFRIPVRRAIESVTEIASLFEVSDKDATSREILPQLESRMRRWLRREIVSVEFVQYADLCLIRVTEQPDIASNSARSTAFNLDVIGDEYDAATFSPHLATIDQNIEIFINELDAGSMMMVGIPILNEEATKHIQKQLSFDIQQDWPTKPENCVVTELLLEGWTIERIDSVNISNFRILDERIRAGTLRTRGRPTGHGDGWPTGRLSL